MTVDSTTGISGVKNESSGLNAKYTAIDGRRVAGKPAPGIYIIRYGAKASKIIVDK